MFSVVVKDDCSQVVCQNFDQNGRRKGKAIINIFAGSDKGELAAKQFALFLNKAVEAFYN